MIANLDTSLNLRGHQVNAWIAARGRPAGGVSPDVMNITLDTQYTQVLFFYATSTTTMRADGYRWKNTVRAAARPAGPSRRREPKE